MRGCHTIVQPWPVHITKRPGWQATKEARSPQAGHLRSPPVTPRPLSFRRAVIHRVGLGWARAGLRLPEMYPANRPPSRPLRTTVTPDKYFLRREFYLRKIFAMARETVASRTCKRRVPATTERPHANELQSSCSECARPSAWPTAQDTCQELPGDATPAPPTPPLAHRGRGGAVHVAIKEGLFGGRGGGGGPCFHFHYGLGAPRCPPPFPSKAQGVGRVGHKFAAPSASPAPPRACRPVPRCCGPLKTEGGCLCPPPPQSHRSKTDLRARGGRQNARHQPPKS